MDNSDLLDLHKPNIRNSLILGLAVPGPRNPSILFSFYLGFLNTYQLTVISLMSLSVVLKETTIHKVLMVIASAYVQMFGFAVSIYYLFYRNQLQQLMKRFDGIIQDCLNDPLDEERTFRKRFNLDNRLIYKCASIIPLVSGLCPMTYYAIGIARRLKLFGMDGKWDITVDTVIPNLDQSPNFEIAEISCMIGIQLGISRKASVEWFLMSLMALSLSFLNHLETTLMKVLSNDKSQRKDFDRETDAKDNSQKIAFENSKRFNLHTGLVEERIKLWVKLHQNVLKLNEDLIVTLSPLMAYYLVNITTISAITIFTVTTDEEMILIEKMSMGYFSIASVITLFLLCYFGNQLFLKSGQLAEPAFWKCFESGSGSYNKGVYGSLKVIFQRTRRPLIYAPYKTPNFTFTNESFVSFAWSMISFYFAIEKLKEMTSH